MKRVFLFAATMLLTVSFAGAKESTETTNEVNLTVVAPATSPMVYSNCYDGYLNVRQAPTTKSQIVGKLKNGYEGAELLGVEGSWSKVRVNGVVGYVASKYLQSTPTEPVYIDASVVLGEWYGDASGLLKINSNGTFKHTFGWSPTMAYTLEGTWHLAGKKIVLKYIDENSVTVCDVVSGEMMVSEEEEETFNRLD